MLPNWWKRQQKKRLRWNLISECIFLGQLTCARCWCYVVCHRMEEKNMGRNKSNHKYEYLMIKRWAFALISSPLTVVVSPNGWYTTTERCNKWNNLVRNSQMLKCVCPRQLRATPERARKWRMFFLCCCFCFHHPIQPKLFHSPDTALPAMNIDFS